MKTVKWRPNRQAIPLRFTFLGDKNNNNTRLGKFKQAFGVL